MKTIPRPHRQIDSCSAHRQIEAISMIEAPRVLLIEDNEILQIVNKQLLEHFGCQVDLAADAVTAMALYQVISHYDLILSDVGLPDHSGIDVVRWIRQYDKEIPIVMLTAFGDMVKEQCLAAGATDFYVKPIALDKLQCVLEKYIPNFNS